MEELHGNFNNNVQGESQDVKEMNFFQRVIGIVISPSETMKNLIAKPRILFPILAMALGPVLLNLIRFSLYQETVRLQMEKSFEIAAKSGGQQLAPEQIDLFVRISTYGGLIAAPIVVLGMWLAGTAILFGIVKALGGKGKFKQYLSITGYVSVITLLSIFITLIVSFYTNRLTLDLSLGIFAKQILTGFEGSFLFGFAYTVLSAISLFTLWSYVLYGMGVACLSGLNKRKAYIIVFSMLIILVLAQALFAGWGEVRSGSISSTIM